MPQYVNGYYAGTDEYTREFNRIIQENAVAEAKIEEKIEKDEATQFTRHYFIISSVLIALMLLVNTAMWIIMFFVHHWYTIFICVILLPLPEYASMYTDQAGNMTNAVLAPVNYIFLPALKELFNCLKSILDLYNLFVEIVRAIVHQVLVNFGPPDAHTIFTILYNVFILLRYIVEMFGTAILSAAQFFISLLSGNLTIDFTFIQYLVEFIMGRILHILDPDNCFQPPSDIPYSIEECLSLQQTPPLNRTEIKAEGVLGLVKGLIIIFCGMGKLNDNYFELIVNCTGLQIIYKIRDNAVYDYNLARNKSIQLKNDLDVIKNQLNTINNQLASLIPQVSDYIIRKLCGKLADTVFCDITRSIVNKAVNQVLHPKLQSIENDINFNHNINMDTMNLVNDTKVCVYRKRDSSLIMCLHSTPELNHLKFANGTYINMDILQWRIDQLIADIIAIDLEHRLPTPFILNDITKNETNYMSHQKQREIPVLPQVEAERPFADLRAAFAQQYSYGGENSSADINFTLLEHAIGLLNVTVLSLRRGYRNDSYHWMRDNLAHNNIAIHKLFAKVRSYYGVDDDPSTVHAHVTQKMRALTIDINIIGLISSFVIHGGSTFGSLLNGIMTLVMGVFLASSYLFGILGALINAIEGTPGVHFDFGFYALSVPTVELFGTALAGPVDSALTDEFLTTYAVLAFEIVEVTLLNVLRMVILCNFPLSLAPLTCPPEIVADFTSPSIGTVTFDYLVNLTMCAPDPCAEGSISSTGAICVNGNYLCWPSLPYIEIPYIDAQTDSDLSECTMSGVWFNVGVPWYRVCWNWVAQGAQYGFKFTVRVLVRGYSFPWFLAILGFAMTRVCMCCRSLGNALLYLTFLQLLHYPVQYAGDICPPGRLWGLCDYYQDYIYFDKLDNLIPEDAVLCNGLALPVYILAYLEVVFFLYLLFVMLNAALILSIGMDLVMIYEFSVDVVGTIVFSTKEPHYRQKQKTE